MRIIAGRFKGRRLKTPSWPGLRPTSDKLRETLFNILAARTPGARVLDAYAGTGALGIEALSRGASTVDFVEEQHSATALIRENLAICGVEQGYTIHCTDIVSALARVSDRVFDLMLFDPPYDVESDTVRQVLEAAHSRLAPGGLVVLERPTRREPETPPVLLRVRDVKSGDSTLTFFASRPGPSIDTHGL